MNFNSNNHLINKSTTSLNYNEVTQFKMEINKLTEENISLKTQILDFKNKLNQYDNAFERTTLKIEEQINSYQKQILKLNNYIHEIYLFFNYLSVNYIPSLNFSIQSNEFSLVDFDIFQNKLKIIENYIYTQNKNAAINNDFNNNYILTEGRNCNNKTLEERINDIEKKITKSGAKTNKIDKTINSTNYSSNISVGNLRNLKRNYGVNLGCAHSKKLNLCGNKNQQRYKSSFVRNNSQRKKLNSNIPNSDSNRIKIKKNISNEMRMRNGYNYKNMNLMKGNNNYNSSSRYNNQQRSITPIGRQNYCF